MERALSNMIGLAVIACGFGYLLFGTWHCGPARFLAFAVCLGAGLTVMDWKKEDNK